MQNIRGPYQKLSPAALKPVCSTAHLHDAECLFQFVLSNVYCNSQLIRQPFFRDSWLQRRGRLQSSCRAENSGTYGMLLMNKCHKITMQLSYF